MTPVPWRSSGMRASPSATSAAIGRVKGRPRNRASPRTQARVPPSSPASVDWPLPETPAMATISPACSSRSASRSCARPWPAQARDRRATSSPRARAGARAGIRTSRPTIHRASCASVTSRAGALATSTPARSTATRCETRSTSSSLWLMKMMDSPCATICDKVSNRASPSCGVSTAVGSSRIRMRAPRTRALRISTRWRSPTLSPATRASGCTGRPNRRAVSSSRLRAPSRADHGRHQGSVPSITLSSTLRLSASVECWCTMPMPAASAALGCPGGSGRPKTSMRPASAS